MNQSDMQLAIKCANALFRNINNVISKILELSSELAGVVITLANSENENLKRLANKIIDKHSIATINLIHNSNFSAFSKLNDSMTLQDLYNAKEFSFLDSADDVDRIKQLTTNIISILNPICEISSDITNTILFRNVTVDNRNISIINRYLPIELSNNIKNIFKKLADYFHIFNHTLTSFSKGRSGRNISNPSVGFTSGYSPSINAMLHSKIRPQSMINCDISKFFESTTYVNTVENNLIYNGITSTLIYIRYSSNKIPSECKDTPMLYRTFSVAFYINQIFMLILPVLMHNGRIPTGASYSPSLSNIILRSFDVDMLSFIRELKNKHSDVLFKYTRYADDITISASEDKDLSGNWILSIDTVKSVESILNKYGYYLKYEKTNISGKSDKKEVTGVRIHVSKTDGRILSKSTGQEKNRLKTKICVSSDKKREIAIKLAEYAKNNEKVDSSTLGTLSWIMSVSNIQHSYCVSHYLANKSDISNLGIPLHSMQKSKLNLFCGRFNKYNAFLNLLTVNQKVMLFKKLFSSIDSESFYIWLINEKFFNNNSISIFDLYSAVNKVPENINNDKFKFRALIYTILKSINISCDKIFFVLDGIITDFSKLGNKIPSNNINQYAANTIDTIVF